MSERLDQIPASDENINKLESWANADFWSALGTYLVFTIVSLAYLYALAIGFPITMAAALGVTILNVVAGGSMFYFLYKMITIGKRADEMRQELGYV